MPRTFEFEAPARRGGLHRIWMPTRHGVVIGSGLTSRKAIADATARLNETLAQLASLDQELTDLRKLDGEGGERG